MRFTSLVLAGLLLPLTLASADGTSSTPGFSVRTGIGLTIPLQEELNSVLTSLGQTPLKASDLVAVDWAYGLIFDGFSAEVVASRTTNNVFGPLTGNKRTRFVEDATELTLGGQWEFFPQMSFTGGVGVGVSKFLLQTYPSGASSLSAALASTGQVSVVSSWNWTPLASARLSWRFWQLPGSKFGYSLGVGVTAKGFFLPAHWKLNDDVAISGIEMPWKASWKPVLWLGIE